jgi:hypothetical protein
MGVPFIECPQLLNDYFVREQERGAAVVKLHQVHVPPEVNQFAKDAWLFLETAQPLAIPYRPH